ncbi:MAG: cytochrome c [Acidobacteria bacterium]|nr:cytochrome c [Acidobacteriota bacterium]
MTLTTSGIKTRRGAALALCGVVSLLSACITQDMANQPKVKPLAASAFFKDGRGARPLVPGTVARGQLREDEHLYTGKINGVLVDAFPAEVTKDLKALMARGRERYQIFCTPCHGALGDGRGMVVQRGLRQPPSYHIERLRTAPAGHFFDVMTNGLGAMQDYSAQISVEDRWAIVAYVRALQLSQHAKVEDVAADSRWKLNVSNSVNVRS